MTHRAPPYTAYCALHCRLMTDKQIRRRRCLTRMRWHLWWYERPGGITRKFRKNSDRKESDEYENRPYDEGRLGKERAR